MRASGLEKRYQVFISSTFLDLVEERQAVSQALLKSDCFPAQMENWPAMDAEQMHAIKEIIDASDYYLVISAGKYGSIDKSSGKSYTELEYDYAVSVNKPIIKLLHVDPLGSLAGSQIEAESEIRSKLEAFHIKLKAGTVCKFWKSADQLQTETIVALLDIKKRHPAVGWVAGNAINSEAELEILRLKQELQARSVPKNLADSEASFEFGSKLRLVAEKLSTSLEKVSPEKILVLTDLTFENGGSYYAKAHQLFEAFSSLTSERVAQEALVSCLLIEKIIAKDTDGDCYITDKGREMIEHAKFFVFLNT